MSFDQYGAALRRAKRAALNNSGTGRTSGDRLTLAQKRDIVRAVVGRFENPADVAKRIGCNKDAIYATVRAYRDGRFSMVDEVES